MPDALIYEKRCERCGQKFMSQDHDATICGQCKAQLQKIAQAEEGSSDTVMPSEDPS